MAPGERALSALTPDALQAALAAHERREFPDLPGQTNHLRAGVLVPIRWDAAGPTVVATARPETLRTHGGQVCFPGGRRDPDDVDLYATALREAREEVGIEDARLLGELSSMPLYTSSYRLEPYVAEIADARLRPNPDEVAAVIEVGLLEQVRAAFHDGIPWEQDGVQHVSPVFTFGEHVMFGGTAHVLYELIRVAAKALEREPPGLRPGRYQWSDLL